MNRVLPPAPPAPVPVATSAEGCASGECLPEEAPKPIVAKPATPAPAPVPAPVVTRPAAPAPVAAPVVVSRDEEPEDEIPEPVARPAPNAPKGPATDEDKWRRAVDQVRDASPRHGKSLSYARFLGFTPEGVRVAFPPDAAFHRSQVIGMSRALVEGELAKSLGRPIKLTEETDAKVFEAAPKSIAEVEQNDRSTRERGIAEKVKAHPALRNVLRHLGGALEHIAYLEPVTRPPASAPTPDEGDAGPSVD